MISAAKASKAPGQPAVGPLASLLAGQYAGVDQDLEVVRHRELGQTNRVGQLAHAGLGVRMGSDERDQPEPRRISQRLEPSGQSIASTG